MIVAYNMTEVKPDKTEVKYNLPPGWVKCDGKYYYTFMKDNKTIAVRDGYNQYTNIYDDATQISINDEFNQDNQSSTPIKKIIVPDLRGRFIYGASKDTALDKYIFTDNTKAMQQQKGGFEDIRLKVDEIAHNHLTHIGLESNTANVVYGSGRYPQMSTNISSSESSNFLSFKFENIPATGADAMHVMTTSDFFEGGYVNSSNNLTYTQKNDHDMPHKNMPPYYTLIYIMKIASEVIYPHFH